MSFVGIRVMKKCKLCTETKNFTEFHKKSSTKDGYYGFCKTCKAAKDKEYNAKNKLAIARKTLAYRKKHKAAIAACNKKKYYTATPEEVEVRKGKKRIRTKNAPEAVKQRKRDYDKKYFASEAGKITTARSVHKRRAQKIATEDGTVTAVALELLKVTQKHACYHCSVALDFSAKGKVHLDHLIPLSKGGCHSIVNVAWSCASCNLRKSDTILQDG